ncbi:MAG TPA: rhodanese-like domain-containing protein [Candidatus Acidoferrum sp.]|nr:rhodanese-like domain-containing protein [Candidatus Acidoferrum sp.]
MPEIEVSQLNALREQTGKAQLVDVRSAGEFAAGHVPGAANIPLEEIERRIGDLSAEQMLVLICKSGKRAGLAADFLKDKRKNLAVLQGGTDAWAKTGLPLVVSAKSRWALDRQVRLAIGLLVLSSVVVSLTIYPPMVYLAGLVGLGLTGAGLTDFCPMGILLAKMPWNRASESAPAACSLPHGN